MRVTGRPKPSLRQAFSSSAIWPTWLLAVRRAMTIRRPMAGKVQPGVPMDVLVQSVIGVVASATRNSVSLEDDRDPMAARVSDLTTRRLARVLASRINTGARRRLPRLTEPASLRRARTGPSGWPGRPRRA